MTVSIHQPNYMPWLGYFDKMAKSDVFVVFDDVQFPRGKNHFGHRNQIRTNAGSKWLTVPLVGKSDFKKFNEIQVNYNGWNQEHIRLLECFYNKTPFFQHYYNDIKSLLEAYYDNLTELNMALIRYFAKCLQIDTKIVFSSQIEVPHTGGSEKIFNILSSLKASRYISGTGPGSMRYIDARAFVDRGIELIWQHYNHPTYRQQHSSFMPFMSVVDLLFNEGPNSKNLI